MKRASFIGTTLAVLGLGVLGVSGMATLAQSADDPVGALPMRGGPGTMMMQLGDTNHDGYLTTDEMIALCNSRFTQMDKAHRGSIRAEDFQPGFGRFPGNGQPPAGMGQGRGGMGQGTMGKGGPRGPGQDMMFQAMDRNHDKVVSRAEFIAFHLDRMAMADTDADGRLSMKEVETMPRGPGAVPPPPMQ